MERQLIPLDVDLFPNSSGLANIGATCWFNSIVQSLMSSTSLIKTMKEDAIANNTISSFIKLYNEMSNNAVVSPTELFTNMKINGTGFGTGISTQFGNSQEDAYEGLLCMLESFKSKKIENLFMYKYEVCVVCVNCRYMVKQSDEVANIFDISENDINNELNQKMYPDNIINGLVRSQIEFVREYKCEKCGKNSAWKTKSLKLIPENIVIVFKKYLYKTLVNFPDTLEIPAKNGHKLMFKLVAMSLHYGNMHGGHYTAMALRKNGVFNFNDGSVSPGNFEPSLNTYIVFYHYSGMV